MRLSGGGNVAALLEPSNSHAALRGARPAKATDKNPDPLTLIHPASPPPTNRSGQPRPISRRRMVRRSRGRADPPGAARSGSGSDDGRYGGHAARTSRSAPPKNCISVSHHSGLSGRRYGSVMYWSPEHRPPLILVAIWKLARDGEKAARRTSPPAGRTASVRSSRSSRSYQPSRRGAFPSSHPRVSRCRGLRSRFGSPAG